MKLLPDLMLRREFDGTGMLFNPNNGKTFYLNQTAAFICGLLEEGADEATILAEIKNCAENVSENAERELGKFLDELRGEGFLCD